MYDQGSLSGKRLSRAVRERQIVDAAVEVFSRRGYHAASMDEISAVADISKPMVYVYLGSKEALFKAAVRREVARLLRVISEEVSLTSSTPEERLWTGVHAFFAFVSNYPSGWRVVYRQGKAQGVPFVAELAAARTQALAEVTQLLKQVAHKREQDVSALPVDGLSAAIVGACESLADWWLDNPGESAEKMATCLMDLVWIGCDGLIRGDHWCALDKDGYKP